MHELRGQLSVAKEELAQNRDVPMQATPPLIPTSTLPQPLRPLTPTPHPEPSRPHSGDGGAGLTLTLTLTLALTLTLTLTLP